MIEGELRDYIGHRVKGAFKGTVTGLKYDESIGETVFVITKDGGEEVTVPTRAKKIAEMGLRLF